MKNWIKLSSSWFWNKFLLNQWSIITISFHYSGIYVPCLLSLFIHKNSKMTQKVRDIYDWLLDCWLFSVALLYLSISIAYSLVHIAWHRFWRTTFIQILKTGKRTFWSESRAYLKKNILLFEPVSPYLPIIYAFANSFWVNMVTTPLVKSHRENILLVYLQAMSYNNIIVLCIVRMQNKTQQFVTNKWGWLTNKKASLKICLRLKITIKSESEQWWVTYEEIAA